MSTYPHTVTVGETFGGAKVEITLSFTDAATGFGPPNALGGDLAGQNSTAGRALRESLFKSLPLAVDRANAAVWKAENEAIMDNSRRTLANVEAQIQAAKDETAKKYDQALETVAAQSAERLAAVDAAYTDAEKRLRQDIDALKAQLAAKSKRSRAATKGHAKKAGRK